MYTILVTQQLGMVINAEIDRNQEEHEQATRKTVRWSDHQSEISPQSLGMVFGTYSTSTPNENTEKEIPTPPRPNDLTKVYYTVTPKHEAGNGDPFIEDDFMMNGQNCRISKTDLSLEVVEDITRVQDGLPPINTIFIKRNGEPGDESRDTTAEFTPSSSEGIPATPDLGSPEKEISPSKY